MTTANLDHLSRAERTAQKVSEATKAARKVYESYARLQEKQKGVINALKIGKLTLEDIATVFELTLEEVQIIQANTGNL